MPFQKGQSGNPKGRAIEKPFADALRMELAAAGKDHKALRKIAKALINKASDGDLQAIKEFADRVDGKASQTVSHGGEIAVVGKDQRDAAVAAATRADS